MIIIQNNIKKGILIPELNIEVIGSIINISAIDKIKYADFLALQPKVIITNGEFIDQSMNSVELKYINYIGDIISFEVDFGIITYFMTTINNI